METYTSSDQNSLNSTDSKSNDFLPYNNSFLLTKVLARLQLKTNRNRNRKQKNGPEVPKWLSEWPPPWLRTNVKDGGYGWITVILSFTCNTVIWGIMWTIGIWTQQFKNEFTTASMGYISFVGSGINAMTYLSGLVGSFLQQKYGNGRVIMGGAILATMGLLASSAAMNVEFLFFSFSLLVGAGLGVTFIPSVVAVSDYFHLRLPLAMGLAVAGVGFGMLIYPPINNIFLERFGWRHALLCNTAFTVVLFLCGLFMVPFNAKNAHSASQSTDCLSEDEGVETPPPSYEYACCFPNDEDQDKSQKVRKQPAMLDDMGYDLEDDPGGIIPSLIEEGVLAEEQPRLRQPQQQHDHDQNQPSLFKTMLSSLEIFKVPNYVLFCVNNLLFFSALTITWVHMNSYIVAAGLGNASDANLVFCVIGASNTLGRILLGLLVSHDNVTASVVFTFGNFLLGLTQFYTPFADTYESVMVTSVIFGLVSAVGGTLLPPILIDFLGPDKLGASYGFLLIFEGTGSLIGPPVAGTLFEMSLNYNSSFYLAAACYVVGGLIMLPTLLLKKNTPPPIKATPLNCFATPTAYRRNWSTQTQETQFEFGDEDDNAVVSDETETNGEFPQFS